jgi:hypothetical protein
LLYAQTLVPHLQKMTELADRGVGSAFTANRLQPKAGKAEAKMTGAKRTLGANT